MKPYLKPNVKKVTEEVTFLRADAQYILNITDQWCHGDACGDPETIELPSGTDFYDDGCLDSGEDPTGDYMDLKCLETGDQLYHMVVVGYTYGGSAECDIDETPAIIHETISPGLPPVCTITAEIDDEGDQCQEPCN